MTPDRPSERPQAYENMLTSIMGLAESLRGIQGLGSAQYTPVVDHIIASRSRDVHQIQWTLDHLLDLAGHPAGLRLYKSLCRYYYTIDPVATADYVESYREMWDSEETEVAS